MKRRFKIIGRKVIVGGFFVMTLISCESNINKSPNNSNEKSYENSSTGLDEQNNVENDLSEQNISDVEFDISKHLSGNSFSLNGNGSVSFNVFSNGNGSIMINGNGNTLEGTINITSNSSFSVRDLVATGGNYDASNNSGSYGTFVVSSNGDLSGSLSDRNGNSSYVTFNVRH